MPYFTCHSYDCFISNSCARTARGGELTRCEKADEGRLRLRPGLTRRSAAPRSRDDSHWGRKLSWISNWMTRELSIIWGRKELVFVEERRSFLGFLCTCFQSCARLVISRWWVRGCMPLILISRFGHLPSFSLYRFQSLPHGRWQVGQINHHHHPSIATVPYFTACDLSVRQFRERESSDTRISLTKSFVSRREKLYSLMQFPFVIFIVRFPVGYDSVISSSTRLSLFDKGRSRFQPELYMGRT